DCRGDWRAERGGESLRAGEPLRAVRAVLCSDRERGAESNVVATFLDPRRTRVTVCSLRCAGHVPRHHWSPGVEVVGEEATEGRTGSSEPEEGLAGDQYKRRRHRTEEGRISLDEVSITYRSGTM